MPLDVLFDGWRAAKAHPEFADATLELYGHLGFFKQSADPLIDKIPLDEGLGITYHGPLAKTDVGDAYRSLDALVFCVPGAKYVTSGKIFEYMATGKPIVSVHAPDIAAVDVLTGHPLWFGIDRLDAQAVGNAMVSAAKRSRDLTEADFKGPSNTPSGIPGTTRSARSRPNPTAVLPRDVAERTFTS